VRPFFSPHGTKLGEVLVFIVCSGHRRLFSLHLSEYGTLSRCVGPILFLCIFSNMEAFQIAVIFIVELALDEHCANAFLQFVAVIFLIMSEALLLTFN